MFDTLYKADQKNFIYDYYLLDGFIAYFDKEFSEWILHPV